MPKPIQTNSNANKVITSNILLEPWLMPLITSLDLPLNHVYKGRPKLLKIIKFVKISFKDGVKLILSDSNHLILGEIPKDVYLEHERVSKSRFTQDSKNVLLLVKKLKFKFCSKQEIFTRFGILLDNSTEVLQKYCILELNEFSFYNRDEVFDPCSNLPWVYDDADYRMYKGEVVGEEIDPFKVQ